MANLKEIRNRITSVGSTMQITSAMKMVSAAKLKRAQDAVTQMRPYAGKLKEILENLSATLDLSENAFSEQREVKNVLLVGITSNRGLCGGFNNNIIKRVGVLINEDYKEANVQVLSIGKKIKDVYKRTEFHYVNEKMEQMEDVYTDLRFEVVAELAEEII
ncbi:MAG: F0F1 ATP synthase subunit gamma, partial [Crocinitomicaceae bacterium]